MRDRTSSTSVASDADTEASARGEGETPPSPSVAPAPPPGAVVTAFVSAGHEALFEDDGAPRCDICGDEVPADPDDGSSYAGSALYVAIRGDRVVYDEPPLCASCALAVGVTALARWDLEEEEG